MTNTMKCPICGEDHAIRTYIYMDAGKQRFRYSIECPKVNGVLSLSGDDDNKIYPAFYFLSSDRTFIPVHVTNEKYEYESECVESYRYDIRLLKKSIGCWYVMNSDEMIGSIDITDDGEFCYSRENGYFGYSKSLKDAFCEVWEHYINHDFDELPF